MTDAVLLIKVGYYQEADKVTMLRNIYSTTANRSNDPRFFQTHKHHATTQTLRVLLHMFVQATSTRRHDTNQ